MNGEAWIGWIESFEQMLREAGWSATGATVAVRAAGLAVAIGLAAVVYVITRAALLQIVHRAVKRTRTQWDDVLMRRGVFVRLAHVAPVIVLYAAAGIVLAGHDTAMTVMQHLAIVYLVLVAVWVVDALLNAATDICASYAFSRRVPVRGFAQVIKLLVYLAVGVAVVSLLVGRDPTSLLAGMGAMTAVLLLVFKDSILGLVAGIQLSVNDMVRLGDWIEMPRYNADGDVIDISLTTVKVQNWDKTISTIPAYALVSETFKNWRGMTEAGGRRIKRCVYIDMHTIRFCDAAMLERFRRIRYLRDYVEAKLAEIAEWNRVHDVDEQIPVNGRRLTNVGTFRAYLVAYLRNHPLVRQDMTLLVRHLEPTPHGLPIQVYVFSKQTAWADYEALQADLFDHILAIVPEFGLRVFQEPSGADFARLAAEQQPGG